MPRPEANIDLQELEKLSAMQCTDEEIAAYMRVSTRTIERRRKVQSFREAMERGKAKGRVSVRRNLFRLATNGNLGANIFLAKNLLGYKDVVSNEHSGPEGGPISDEPRRCAARPQESRGGKRQ
jgi:hypothetical protein